MSTWGREKSGDFMTQEMFKRNGNTLGTVIGRELALLNHLVVNTNWLIDIEILQVRLWKIHILILYLDPSPWYPVTCCSLQMTLQRRRLCFQWVRFMGWGLVVIQVPQVVLIWNLGFYPWGIYPAQTIFRNCPPGSFHAKKVCNVWIAAI